MNHLLEICAEQLLTPPPFTLCLLCFDKIINIYIIKIISINSLYYSRLFIVKYSIIFQISSIDTIKIFIYIYKKMYKSTILIFGLIIAINAQNIATKDDGSVKLIWFGASW